MNCILTIKNLHVFIFEITKRKELYIYEYLALYTFRLNVSRVCIFIFWKMLENMQ